jgi:hypothetical protein
MALNTTHSSVFDLIGTFTRGLDIYQRKKHKKKKKNAQPKKLEDADIRLPRSLRKSVSDIQSAYNQKYERHGERFRIGDGKWNAFLQQLLVFLPIGGCRRLHASITGSAGELFE